MNLLDKMSKILVVDIETTDFLQRGGKIVEVGLVELDLSTGKKKILFDNVVHETGISREEVENSWIVKNSDLSVEQIRMSKNLEFYRVELQHFFNCYEAGITAFNRDFDVDFLKSRSFNLPKLLPCPMKLSTDICKLPSSRPGQYKWPKVQEAWDFFFGKTGYIEKHRGADDAFHEADIVFELYKRNVFKIA